MFYDANCSVGKIGKSTSSPQLSRKPWYNQTSNFDVKTTAKPHNIVTSGDTSPDDLFLTEENEEKTEDVLFSDPPLSPVRITRIDSVDSVAGNEQEYDCSNDMEIVDTKFDTQPDVEIEIEQDPQSPTQLNITDSTHATDPEYFFDELMGSIPETTLPSSDPSQVFSNDMDIAPTPSTEIMSENVFMEDLHDIPSPPNEFIDVESPVPPPEKFTYGDDNITPRGSPFISPAVIRRWSVKKRPSYDQSDSDSQVTPKASPYIRRNKTLHSKTNSTKQYQEYSTTNINSSYSFQNSGTLVLENNDLIENSSSKSSVVRRHSFGNNAKRFLKVHQKQSSLSTDNTPRSSPHTKSKKRNKKSSTPSEFNSMNNTSSSKHSSKSDISAIGLVESSTAEVNLDKIQPLVLDGLSGQVQNQSSMFILPPPKEFDQPTLNEDSKYNSTDKTFNYVHSSSTTASTAVGNTQDTSVPSSQPVKHNSHFSFHKGKKSSKSKHSGTTTPEGYLQSPDIIAAPDKETELPYITVVPPNQSNPEELVSFDEILQSFDRYSDVTGKTNKGKPDDASSPQPKKKNKNKRRNRSLTVATIDKDTMEKVKQEIEKNECTRSLMVSDTSTSKVQQLAREYSKRIKESEKPHLVRRYSTLIEEPKMSERIMAESKEPLWLQKLRERKKSTNQPSVKLLDASAVTSLDSHDHSDGHRTDNELHYQPSEDRKGKTGKNKAHTLQLTASLDAVSMSRVKSRTHQHSDTIESFPSDAEPDSSRKGKFRGWVQSLVDRFSNKDKV